MSSKQEKGYALFLDFKSAYNAVLHSKLFKRLKKVLNDDEIKLIRAIYSRQTISMQGLNFTPNCGVAQGSLISPGLFNVYVEPLYKKIELQGVPSDCIMAYADDLLIVCSSLDQLKVVIKTVRNWCDKNNFKLNENKSGIVELLPRRGPYKPLFSNENNIDGIPFTSKYKYLGTWISNKLTMDAQLDHIKRKNDFLVTKLFPLLHDRSLSFRINMWEVFVKPLFDQLVHLFYADKAKTNQAKAERLFKYTFKRFTLLSKSTPDNLIYRLAGYSLDSRAKEVFLKDEMKWKERLGVKNKSELIQVSSPKKFEAILPRELQIYINLSRSTCKYHNSAILNSKHLCRSHGIEIPCYEDILLKIEEMKIYKVIFRGGKPKHVLDRFASLKIAKNYVNKLISYLLKLLSPKTT